MRRMVKMRRHVACQLFCMLLLAGQLSAHGLKDSTHRFEISLTPQYWGIYCTRLDIGLALKPSNHILSLGVEYYSGNINQNGDATTMAPINSYQLAMGEGSLATDVIKGSGLQLYDRLVLHYREGDVGTDALMFGYGIGYRTYNVHIGVPMWQASVQDGLTVLQYDYKVLNDKFQALNAFVSMDYRYTYGHLMAEVYGGIGYRKSYNTSEAKAYRSYTRNIYDYEYTGLAPYIGVRLGCVF